MSATASMVRRPMSSSEVHHVILPPLPSHSQRPGRLVNSWLVDQHKAVVTEPGVSVIDLECLDCSLDCSEWLKLQLGLNQHQQQHQQHRQQHSLRHRQPTLSTTNNNKSVLAQRRVTRPESAPACLLSSTYTTRRRPGSTAINSTMTSSSPRPLADNTHCTSSRTRRRRPLGGTNSDHTLGLTTRSLTARRDSDILLRATQILRDDTTTARLLSAGGNTRHHVTLTSSTTDVVAPPAVAESNDVISEYAENSDIVHSTETDDIIHSTRSDDVIEIPTVASVPTSTETDDVTEPESKQTLTELMTSPAVDDVTNTEITELEQSIETSSDKMAASKEEEQEGEEISEESKENQLQETKSQDSVTSSQTVKHRKRELRGGKVRFNDTATVVHEYRPMTPEFF